MKVLGGLSLVACLLGSACSRVDAGSLHVVEDIRFQQQSDQLDAEQQADLEAFRCRVGTAPVEVVLVEGRAARDEAQPDALSARRAGQVVNWLRARTSWGQRIYANQQGAPMPRADNSGDFWVLPNRRVEMDAVLGAPFELKALAQDCTPPWQSALLASAQTAPTVARAVLAGGGFSADAPFRAALQARRWDVFTALREHSGIVLNAQQRLGLVLQAYRHAQLDYFLEWVGSDGPAVAAQDRERFLQWICNAAASQKDRLRAVDALVKVGVVDVSRAFEGCAER